jgi:hypothetical protein
MKQKIKFWIKKNIPPKFIDLFTNKGILITKIPSSENAIISDLFPYRIEDNWNTYFMLLNFPQMLDPKAFNEKPYKIEIIFFNKGGEKVSKYILESTGSLKTVLNIKKIANKLNINLDGTFAVFHLKTTPWLRENKSFMSERGYIGYENKLLGPIKSFVHGNFDAIAKQNDKEYLLSNSSFKLKTYNLQHVLLHNYSYEIFWVNTSPLYQTFKIIEQTKEDIKTTILEVPPRGIQNYKKPPNNKSLNSVITVKSKLYLPRPILFKYMDTSFDVFHG